MTNQEPQSEFIRHTSCDVCDSSDANAIYSNGTSYCFSCEKHAVLDAIPKEVFKIVKETDISKIAELNVRGFKERKIKKEVTDFFDVKVKESGDDITHHYYPYTKEGKIVGYKERQVIDKQFKVIGNIKDTELFGQSKFSAGSAKKIIVTEGEIDCMAVAQAHWDQYQRTFPVVSIPTGAGSSRKSLAANREYLRSFEEVILMFDQDEVGQEGCKEAAKIIGVDKVKIAKLEHKDPSDSYLELGQHGIMNQVWNAQPWCPSGVINDVDLIKEQYLNDRDAVYFPWPEFVSKMNDKIYGRRFGSITMFTSGTGCGKTTFLREDAYHVWSNSDHMVGVCSLEESVAETTRGFISLHLNKRIGIPTTKSTVKEEIKAIDKIFDGGRFMLLDHQGSLADDSLIDKIEFMAVSGCKFIYLDHITIAVSETEGNINQAIDKVMSELLKICKRHDVWIGVVSHLRKTGGDKTSFEDGGSIDMDALKGSGSLKQVSAQIIALSRNLNHEDEAERHKIKLSVLKCRFSGNTGPTCSYSFKTNGRLQSASDTHALSGFKDVS